jgi:hypothetical protein
VARKRKTPGLPPAPAFPNDTVYRLKIALEGIVSQIWRRVEVPDCGLEILHEVIQICMPWDSHHLWCFHVGKTRYIDPEFIDFPEDKPADKTRLSDLVAAGVKEFRYEYDFGDSWYHRITVEKTLPRDPKVKYPRCTAGARACPPEDCGGPPGYERLLYILAHPKHEEHQDMMEWAGGPIDPHAFDPGDANPELGKLKL